MRQEREFRLILETEISSDAEGKNRIVHVFATLKENKPVPETSTSTVAMIGEDGFVMYEKAFYDHWVLFQSEIMGFVEKIKGNI